MRRIPSRRNEIFILEICFFYIVVISLVAIMLVLSMAGPHLLDDSDSFLGELRALILGTLGGANLEGEMAPDFTLSTLSGETFTLSERVDKEIIILNFFATWCAPCRVEIPELVAFHQANRNRPITILGISDETAAMVEDFVEDHGVTYPIGIDTSGIKQLYRIAVFPTTVLIGADGNIHEHVLGAVGDPHRAFGETVERNLNLIKADGDS